MKNKIINNIIKNIKRNDQTISEEQIEIIQYGLESLYLTFTKIVIILLLAIVLNIFKETLMMILFYNVVRFTAFGLHTKNSIACLISSLTLFIGGTYLGIYLDINLTVKIVLSVICIILVSIYAPADTEKRPLINKKKRTIYKILSIITSIIMTFLIIYNNNLTISNFMLIGFVESTFMILPIAYKIYGLPYNNYKSYRDI